MARPQFGGTFAPPLSDEKLIEYRVLADALPASPVKDALLSLLACCEKWWELPEPAATKQWAHPSGKGTVVALQDDHAQALWDLIPWKHELDATQSLFDAIDPAADRDLRNAAFHLLWHVKELDLDREPLTADRL